MQLRKVLAAGTLAALMVGSSVALAADLSDFPQPFITSDGAADFLVVVGAAAAPSDVVGAVDVAARLGGESTVSKATEGTTTQVSLSGKSEEIALDALVTADSKFPTTLKSHHIPALGEDVKVFWDYQTDDYMDTQEQFVLGSLNMSRNPATYNGTISLTVPEPTSATGNQAGNAAFYYRYKFDETMEGPGNLSAINPLKISLLGKEFSITEIGTSYIIAMIGEQLDITAGESGATTSGFTVTPTAYYSADVAWDITLSKGNGTAVTKKLTIGASTDTDFTVGGETVKVRVLRNQTKTTYPAGDTVTVVSVIVGETTELRYQEDISNQPNPKKTQGDNRFPGTDGDWRFDFTVATAGQFTRGDTIDVYFDPWSPDDVAESGNNGQSLNLTVGQKVSLPNDYFDVEFAAMNTESVATVQVQGTEMTVYYGGAGNTTAYWTAVPTVKLTTDKGRFLNASACSVGEDIEKNEVYIVYLNASATAAGPFNIYLATKDSDGYLRNRSATKDLNNTNTNMFTLDYGDYATSLTIQAMNRTNSYDVKIFDYLGDETTIDFTIGPLNTTGYRVYMGDGRNDEPSAADVKVNGTNAAGYRDHYTTYGVEVDDVANNARVDRVVLKVPTTQLKGVVAIGKDISVGGTAGSSYSEANPIKTAVAKLDSEVGDTDKSEKNIVLVGGPCANTLVRTLLESTAATCLSDFEDMGYTSGSAMMKFVEDAWGTGKAALIVAGYDAADTRNACSVLQDYGAYTLSGTEMKVVGSTLTEVA